MPETKKHRARRSIDWAAVETGWRAGASVRALAECHGASPSAIYRRARNEGWLRGDAASPAAPDPPFAEALPQEETPPKEPPGCSPDELAHLRALAVKLRRRLERVIDGAAPNGVVVGARESPAALLLKLCQITEKIIAIERGLAGARTPAAADISKEDHDILDRFRRRYRVE